MMHIAGNKTLRRTWVVSGMMLCLILAGCGHWFSGTANHEPDPRVDRYDQAIAEFDTQLERNPYNARAYYERALVYYNKGEYDKAWRDVRKAQGLGYQVPVEFLKLLSEASQENR